MEKYSWNIPGSPERGAIERFLTKASDHLRAHPDRVVVQAKHANATINWLRALLDRTPMEM